MHRFLVRAQPSFERLLLIESGPRDAGEKALRYLYEVKNAAHVDLLTCYSGTPQTFDHSRGAVYSVHDREVVDNRTRFAGKLAQTPYSIVAILCTGSPILERWKWAIAMRTSARLIVLNEEAAYFTVDLWNLGSVRLLFRKRVSDRGLALVSLMTWVFAPLTISYLAAYTGMAHFRRWLRIRKAAAS